MPERARHNGANGRGAARPFVKWAGGKRRIAAEILDDIPAEFGDYHEPFVGGGALFFELVASGTKRFRRAHLSDLNGELIHAYSAIKSRAGHRDLVRALREYEASHGPALFESTRKRPGEGRVAAAARLIYLNKTCYNGLYRVNSSGEFNVPLGDYPNPNICDEANLRACHRALAVAEAACADFEEIEPREGDVVYCDPPYHATFDSYTRSRFDADAQRRLAACCERWAREGATVLVSNSATPLIDGLYPKARWRRRELMVPRVINSDGAGRQPVAEWLIRNGPP